MIDPVRAASQLRALALGIADQLDTFLASQDETLPSAIQITSNALVEVLMSADPGAREGRIAAWRVLPLVVDPEMTAPLTFWSTDLGRLVARHIGVGRPVATRLEVAAILGFTRQRIHQMVASGALRGGLGGVDNESLTAHIALGVPSV